MLVSILSLLFINLSLVFRNIHICLWTSWYIEFPENRALNPFINSNNEVVQSTGHHPLWHLHAPYLEGNYMWNPAISEVSVSCVPSLAWSWNCHSGYGGKETSLSMTKLELLTTMNVLGVFHVPPQIWD